MEPFNFPVLKNDNLLRAARGEPVDRIPLWVMRQAGRYLPEFKEVRKVHSFFEICMTPELACEVTMQPLRRFDFDASIIFSDILVIPKAYGMDIEMKPGPVFNNPLETPDDVDKLEPVGAIEKLDYVGKAITMMRHKLNGKVPLIGFSGAPFTLMGYMTGGSGRDKDIKTTKEWFTKYPEGTEKLLKMLTKSVIDYLVMQVQAGAQILQVFESTAGQLTKEEFLTIALPHLKEINDQVKKRLTELNVPIVPMILFAKGAGSSLSEQSVLGYDVIGLDYNVDPVEARKLVGNNVTLQGNLNPQDLYKPVEEVRKLVADMVNKFGKDRYIANLGDGITPETPIEAVQALVETVHKTL